MQLLKGKNGRAADKPHKNGKSNGTSLRPEEGFYRPTDKEPFMSERQREYFRLKLLDWREDILKEAKETLQHLQDESQNHPDLADRALFLSLEPIRESRRRTERELWQSFRRECPEILGALLTAAVRGLDALSSTTFARLPRMADFAHWGSACEGALWPAGRVANLLPTSQCPSYRYS